ncbi:hypothetical protein HDV05_007886 [Chytridiales sp. JEL 0842]|nr:hypothetical protein HDV05_007886 [Chytridiales sp. JEL 0842]
MQPAGGSGADQVGPLEHQQHRGSTAGFSSDNYTSQNTTLSVGSTASNAHRPSILGLASRISGSNYSSANGGNGGGGPGARKQSTSMMTGFKQPTMPSVPKFRDMMQMRNNKNNHRGSISAGGSSGGEGASEAAADNKDLRKFLDGIGETDVPSNKNPDFVTETEDAIVSDLPPEFRDYLGNSSSPSSPLPPINNNNGKNSGNNSGTRNGSNASDNTDKASLTARKSTKKVLQDWANNIARKRTVGKKSAISPADLDGSKSGDNMNETRPRRPLASSHMDPIEYPDDSPAPPTTGRQHSTALNTINSTITSSEEEREDGATEELELSQPHHIGHSLNPISTVNSCYTMPYHGQTADDPHLPAFASEQETILMASSRFFLSTLADSIFVALVSIPAIVFLWQLRVFDPKSSYPGTENMRLAVYANYATWLFVDIWALVAIVTDKQVRSRISKFWRATASQAAPQQIVISSSQGVVEAGVAPQGHRGSITMLNEGGAANKRNRRMTTGAALTAGRQGGKAGKAHLGTLSESNADILAEDGNNNAGGGQDSNMAVKPDKADDDDGIAKPPSWRLFCGLMIYTPSRTLAVLARVSVVFTIVFAAEWVGYYFLSVYLGNVRGVVLAIQPAVQFVCCLPVMAYIICFGKGKTWYEQLWDCTWAAFVNVGFVQLIRFGLTLTYLAAVSSPESYSSRLISTLILQLAFDIALLSLADNPRTRSLVLRSQKPWHLIVPKLLTDSIPVTPLVLMAPFSKTFKGLETPKTDERDSTLNFLASLTLQSSLMATVGGRLMVLGASSDGGAFWVTAAASCTIRMLVVSRWIRACSNRSSCGNGGSTKPSKSGYDEEAAQGLTPRGSVGSTSILPYRISVTTTQGISNPHPSGTQATLNTTANNSNPKSKVVTRSQTQVQIRNRLYNTHITLNSLSVPGQAATTRSRLRQLAVQHLMLHTASQASTWVALMAGLLFMCAKPSTWVPLDGYPVSVLSSAASLNLTTTSLSSQLLTPIQATAPLLFDPLPLAALDYATYLWRAGVLILIDWIAGFIVVAFVGSPNGVVYGPIMSRAELQSGGRWYRSDSVTTRGSVPGEKSGGHRFDPRVYGVRAGDLFQVIGSVGVGLSCWLAGVGGVA